MFYFEWLGKDSEKVTFKLKPEAGKEPSLPTAGGRDGRKQGQHVQRPCRRRGRDTIKELKEGQ